MVASVGWLAPLTTWADDKPHPWGELLGSRSSADQECADVLFIGARGSGEPEGLGSTVELVRDELASTTSKSWTRTRQLYLDYPAADPHTLSAFGMDELVFRADMPQTLYFASAVAGERELARVLATEHQRCPDEKVVLAGFSQGAEVITRALNDTLAERLIGVVLVGNPALYPTSDATAASGPGLTNRSIGMSSALFYLREIARSQATADDPEGVNAVVRATIGMYSNEYDEDALAAAVERQHFTVPEDAPVYSACQLGDLVCDSARGLGRVVVGAGTLTDEIDRTRPIHGGYSAQHLRQPLQAVTSHWLSLDKPVASEGASPRPDRQTGAADQDWWQPGAIGATIALMLAIGIGLTRRGFTRHRARRDNSTD